MDKCAILQENWFTEKEAKIYLSSLELWNAPASSIARHCGENRITAYTILKDLVKRWVARESIKWKIKYYIVVWPEKLHKIIEERKKKFSKILPELLAITNQSENKPKVMFFEWLNGLKEAYEDLLTSKTDVLSFLWVHFLDPELKKYLDTEFIQKRVKNKVFAKVIAPFSEYNKNYADSDKLQFRKTILIEDNIFNMENEINIYDEDKVLVALFSKSEMSALLIKSKNLYNSLKSIFDLLLKQYDNKT